MSYSMRMVYKTNDEIKSEILMTYDITFWLIRVIDTTKVLIQFLFPVSILYPKPND